MATTEDDLQAKRAHLQALRDRKESAITKRSENEYAVGLEVEAKQLDAAIAVEEAETARAERSAARAAVRAGIAPAVETVTTARKDAVAVAKAQAKAADKEGE